IAETKREKVDALVFVGDCMEEDPDRICHLAGQLGLLGVPAFVFHERADPRAARTFKEIARLTRGAYCHFDADSARQLRDLLAAVAVYATGGRLRCRITRAARAGRRCCSRGSPTRAECRSTWRSASSSPCC